ncbi:hypothetical protein CPAV1605_1454 [seawater metagenome]|uniref:Uncharacterized protein n=1 Tax=seawater metagenome TaxID=1561972 RepID=A0A5E8CLC2_9ZZZZ
MIINQFPIEYKNMGDKMRGDIIEINTTKNYPKHAEKIGIIEYDLSDESIGFIFTSYKYEDLPFVCCLHLSKEKFHNTNNLSKFILKLKLFIMVNPKYKTKRMELFVIGRVLNSSDINKAESILNEYDKLNCKILFANINQDISKQFHAYYYVSKYLRLLVESKDGLNSKWYFNKFI